MFFYYDIFFYVFVFFLCLISLFLFLYIFLFLFFLSFRHYIFCTFIKLFLGPIGDALGFRASSHRVNHNRILILILASYLNILPKIFSHENNNKSFNFSDRYDKQNIKKVENEVEKVKSNLGKLFSSGWSVFQIFEQIKHKLIKKGKNIYFFCFLSHFFCIFLFFFVSFLYHFCIIFVVFCIFLFR